MISYEFQSFSVLSARIASIGKRVKQDELALYVRRHDISAVLVDLDARKVDSAIKVMHSRVEKHFGASELDILGIKRRVWRATKAQLIEKLTELGAYSVHSYQLQLPASPLAVSALFDKYKFD